MKITIIIGSNQNANISTSYKISEMVRESLMNLGNEVEIMELSKYKIDMCKGCCNCFKTGKCIINDDINMIRKKLIATDHIILVSPVYAHNVTGLLKNFIDRTSNWLHILGLLGKTSSTIVVSSSNGNIYVADYLKKTLEFYGTVYIGNLNITVDAPKMFDDKEMLTLIMDRYIQKLVNFDRTKISLECVEKQSGIFTSFKKVYTTNETVKTFEEEMWTTDKALKKNSFIEAYHIRRSDYLEKNEK